MTNLDQAVYEQKRDFKMSSQHPNFFQKPRSRPEGKSSVRRKAKGTSTGPALLAVDFEVRGKVQGVHFRKYTQNKARALGIRGWCRNTDYGTVIGRIEGDQLKVDMMKDWLKRVGSPKSRIDSAQFQPNQTILNYSYDDFQIIK